MANYIKKPQIFTDRWQYAKKPPVPKSKIGFKIDGLVAMGSCFARNITRWICFQAGIDQKSKQPWDILYNPFSIEKEIERLWIKTNWEKYVLKEVDVKGNKRYRDPWRTWHVFPRLKQLRSANRSFDHQTKKLIQKATAFLFTFGLSEIWSPKKNPQIVLNQVPIGSIRYGKKDWRSRLATLPETYKSLERLVELIRKKANNRPPIIFSLSPVPLKYTASGLPIRQANNISKATLLLAIQKICRLNSSVSYFPSYEIVQALSEKNQSDVWQADGRHVNANIIAKISQIFLKTYKVQIKKKNKSPFWVPKLDKNGRIVGRQYVD